MADLSGRMVACVQSGKLAFLAILVSGGIVLQILACALYNNWWPMLTDSNGLGLIFAVIMYVLLPMPMMFFVGSDASSLFTESSGNSWFNATKFLTGASVVGSIAIPAILKHAGIICWGALVMELSSFFVFVLAIMCFIKLDDDDGYTIL
ncbi:Vacuolar protein sorting-associated protein 55-like protein [Bienertia sinuspersici]